MGIRGEEKSSLSFKINLDKESKIGMQTAKFNPKDSLDYGHVLHSKIKNHARFITSFV